MSDLAIRQAERGGACGDVEAQQRHLRARLRAGQLDKEKLPLLAYCGSEGARHLLGGDGIYVPRTLGGLVRAARWETVDTGYKLHQWSMGAVRLSRWTRESPNGKSAAICGDQEVAVRIAIRVAELHHRLYYRYRGLGACSDGACVHTDLIDAAKQWLRTLDSKLWLRWYASGYQRTREVYGRIMCRSLCPSSDLASALRATRPRRNPLRRLPQIFALREIKKMLVDWIGEGPDV